jgi:hypothetical protein
MVRFEDEISRRVINQIEGSNSTPMSMNEYGLVVVVIQYTVNMPRYWDTERISIRVIVRQRASS